MALLLPLLTVLAQIGPFTPAGAGSAPNVPHVEGRDTPRRTAASAPAPTPLPPPPPQSCAQALAVSPAEAIGFAQNLITSAKGSDLAQAQGCLGLAQGRLGAWAEAETAFLAARDAGGDDHAARAAYGAMAGNAALAGGLPEQALATLTTAQADADAIADKAAAGAIAVDRARALVALRRPAEARGAIDQATTLAPGDSDAWLLSATLYRRAGKLDQAQRHIEQAAAISPLDPAIGLEAGVIAQLAGREAAARKSWQSVIATAPDSAEAAQARDYVAQIGPGPGGLPAEKPL